MHGRLSKYFGTREDSSGNKLFWSQHGEYPFRGNPPAMMKDEEFEQIPLSYDASSELIELPKDQKRYDEIIDHCANGWWQLRHERFIEHTKEDPPRLMVFVAWLEIYGEIPGNKSPWENIKNAPQLKQSR